MAVAVSLWDQALADAASAVGGVTPPDPATVEHDRTAADRDLLALCEQVGQDLDPADVIDRGMGGVV